ncbi:sugar phosphate isomerase/epimerase family protein [Halopenitus persicus]|uniref:Sugar phosphate isomerase/epimerase n=1 Tax=Halopenitus persicus TaxID=1048396 RepID=A0A1H3LIW3_9EURY|nr:sugar phosphate isomerase/epimerase family protein [Halopenitus persicus]SDY63898.1 Sugar phosphate isomerase/epimerase [Halopenitus persicus]
MTRLGAAMDIRFTESVPEFLEHITALGLNHVEFKREYLHGHPDAPDADMLGELADDYGVSVTLHAPFRDWNLGSFNDASRAAAVEQVKATLDDAATCGAGAVVVHGGSVPERYPTYVHEKAYQNARKSLAECAAHAADVGVPLCLENQPPSASKRRYTTTPDDFRDHLRDNDGLDVTLDVGHAKVSGHGWKAFHDHIDEHVRVLHIHDNDGESDQHQPHDHAEELIAAVNPDYAVLELKQVADIERCVMPTS